MRRYMNNNGELNWVRVWVVAFFVGGIIGYIIARFLV